MNFTRRVLGGPTTILALLLATLLALGMAGCSSDDTGAPAGNNEQATGVFHVDLSDQPAEFEIISAKNGDPDDPILGPMAILGRNIRYDADAGALVMDLSVKNIGEETYDEPVTLTFLALLPDGVTVENADNGETGAGAAVEFQFENDDAMWTPGEESLAREVMFGVAEGEAIGFVARLDAGNLDGDMGSIGGMVWNDEDGDGMMGDDEAGVEGVTIMLSGEHMNTTSVETMTSADGTYTFDDLESGFYTVVRKPVDGWVGTTANTIYVVLVTDDGNVVDFLAANFGVMADGGGDPMGIIQGLVWNDLNGDGMVDDGEPGVADIPIYLAGDATDSTMTMADGTYAFEGLAAGMYEIVSDGPMGWSLTTGSPIQAVLPENDSVFSEGSFGWMEDVVDPTGSISGVVFNDLNGNGVLDDGETGVADIMVHLAYSDITKDLPDSVLTDADGMYMFDGLGAGNYVVTSVGPEGWAYTTGPLNVMLDADDSVVDNADHGWMEEVAGPTGMIKGLVWNDLNGDGMVDDDEPGIEGIEIILSGMGSGTTTTAADGTYAFEGLSAGAYMVTSVGPSGWSLTTPGLIAATLAADDSVFDEGSFGWMEDAP